jgi:hypothetical protein
MVVAPGRMIDSFLSIPDAESLPLYRMVLKLACVYMKRDSIGNAGCNKRISIRIFAPSLTQYISDNSKRHADKILLSTGAHQFPMLPTISTSLRVKVQKFDLMRLLLSTSTRSKIVQRQWLDELDYFHEVNTEGKMYTDVIKEFREAGNRMRIARSCVARSCKVPKGTLCSLFMTTVPDTAHIHFLPSGRLRHRSRFNSRSSATRDLPVAVVALHPSPRPPARARSRKTLKGELTFRNFLKSFLIF